MTTFFERADNQAMEEHEPEKGGPPGSDAQQSPAPNAGSNGQVEDNLPLVREVAKRLPRSLRTGWLDLDDLCAYGSVGLLQAAERFDCTRRVKFETFARKWIRGAILEGVRKEHGWFGRRARGKAKIVHLEDLAGGHWENECLGALADPGLPVSRRWNGRPMCGPQVEADDSVYAALATELERLPERQRRVIELHYYKDKKLSEAAEEMQTGRPSVSRLHARAIDNLRVGMGKGTVVPLPSRSRTRKQSGVPDRQEGKARRQEQSPSRLVRQARK
jgi:RNA polymerase sigma factor for flagellar operon FliA